LTRASPDGARRRSHVKNAARTPFPLALEGGMVFAEKSE
jgi:hypothetical protein